MSLELLCPVTSLWGASLYGCNGEAEKMKAMAGDTPSLRGGIHGQAAGRRPGDELTPALSAGHTTPIGFGTRSARGTRRGHPLTEPPDRHQNGGPGGARAAEPTPPSPWQRGRRLRALPARRRSPPRDPRPLHRPFPSLTAPTRAPPRTAPRPGLSFWQRGKANRHDL